MPLQATSGAASYDGFGGGVAAVSNYIEDVFSTYLYTGNGTSQTITNGIDLAGKGGLVWIKDRAISSAQGLFDTVSGATKYVQAQSSTSQNTDSTTLTSFNSNGFSLGSNGNFNSSASSIAAWTFRQQAKFFTVVSWTGNGANRAINHDLGSVPGCILIKCKSNVGTNWAVYHRSIANTEYLTLNTTDAKATNTTYWNSTTPTNTQFSLGTSSLVNANGFTYVAYLFAHDAGGFGLTGTDNVISCGSFTADGSGNATVNLGYEPQYILSKCSSSAEGWIISDVMRGDSYSGTQGLFANTSGAEFNNFPILIPTATGFVSQNGQCIASATYIYIAIRRGPMKVPTSGTSVFSPLSRAGTSSLTTISSGSVGVVDTIMAMSRNVANGMRAWDRLRGVTNWLGTYTTQAETAATGSVVGFDSMTGVRVNDGTNEVINTNSVASPYINYMFKRAPSFFDEVCYTGTGSARTVAHNLGVAPELMIVKARVSAGGTNRNWAVYASSLGAGTQAWLNTSDAAFASSTIWANTSPTASVFSVSTNVNTNYSGATYVAYLFATCAGVSKVGSYTGNGSSQTINCGFTSGARFVLIKSTSAAGHWRVYDTARGIVAGNEPELFLNLTDAEQTVYDAIDTDSSGFIVNSNGANVNDSGVTYIFLAIA